MTLVKQSEIEGRVFEIKILDFVLQDLHPGYGIGFDNIKIMIMYPRSIEADVQKREKVRETAGLEKARLAALYGSSGLE